MARAPRREPPGGPLDGRCERVGPPRWADGIPGGPPLACARAWRSTQAAADSDSPLHPVVPARDPPRRPLGWPPLDVRECARHRDNAAVLLVWSCGGTAGGPDMAARRKALVDGEEDDEVLGTSNPGDCPYDPGDCPGIEVVGSETGGRRRPCARRRPPHGLSGRGFEDDRVRPRGGVAFQWRRSRRVRFSVTSRRPGGVGQPPARLRGTMENGSTGQMRSSNPPPGCGAGCAGACRSRLGVWPHGKAHSGGVALTEKYTLYAGPHVKPHSARRTSRKGAVCVAARTQSALFGETRRQNALFRRAAPRLPR